MKKILMSLLILGMFATIVPQVFARENENEQNHEREDKEDKKAKESEVLGTVLQCNNKLAYVQVKATCGSQTLSGSTGSTGGDLGKYSLTFKNNDCKKGSTVNVSAKVVVLHTLDLAQWDHFYGLKTKLG